MTKTNQDIKPDETADTKMIDTQSKKKSTNPISAAFTRFKNAITYLKAHKKQLFWYWIGYQCVKGTITTSFIWIPLIYTMLHSS
ncbi:MAG: hypothetical protein GW778_01365 [Alphaproteobacteria bacterium]|nr:hypothetical protein [Alphaproteobacteria bacterium]